MIKDIKYVAMYYNIKYQICNLPKSNTKWIRFINLPNKFLNIINETWINDYQWYSKDLSNTLLDGLICFFTMELWESYHTELTELTI